MQDDVVAEDPRSHGRGQVTATTTWSVDWSVLGVTGNVMMDRSTSRTLDVGELVSVVVR